MNTRLLGARRGLAGYYVAQFQALTSTVFHLALLLLVLDYRVRLERA